MDAQALLDELIKKGKELAEKGKTLAAEKIELPPEGEQRDAMVSGLSKGAVIAGTLALLLGTKTGRSVTGSLLRLGSLAAVGGIGWKVYQDWAGSKTVGTPFSQLSGSEAKERGLMLLRAMVAAAKCDGHINAEEEKKIMELVARLELDDDAMIAFRKEIEHPPSAEAIAREVDTQAVAAEVYMTSLTVVDLSAKNDRHYMDQLANALDLPPELVTRLEDESLKDAVV